jgi:hypothetical protein
MALLIEQILPNDRTLKNRIWKEIESSEVGLAGLCWPIRKVQRI